METVLLLDTETTGLSVQTDHVIEVAVCLFDLNIGTPIESYASLIRGVANPAEEKNKIPAMALLDAPRAADVWHRVVEVAEKADCIAAHRAEFDRAFVKAAIHKVASAGDILAWPEEAPWACTKTDFRWPSGGMGDHLVHLALHYGLGVCSAHRAATDVDMMARILSRVHQLGHSLPELFRRAVRPKKKYVSLAPFEQKDVVKQHGFLWDGERRVWYRHMPPEDISALPFSVREATS